MVAYADTSFLVPLYLLEENSNRAIEIVTVLTEPLPITPLHLLEFRNALNVAIKRKELTHAQRNNIWKTFEKDTAQGGFFRAALSPEALNRSAADLSDRYTPTVGTRSLDLLHLAQAKLLGAKTLLTFDIRQGQAGTMAGFHLPLP